jgi:hypothetical protein
MIVSRLAAAAFSEILTTCLLSDLLKEDGILHPGPMQRRCLQCLLSTPPSPLGNGFPVSEHDIEAAAKRKEKTKAVFVECGFSTLQK